jgi:N-acetylneuraminic acid mutarotase
MQSILKIFASVFFVAASISLQAQIFQANRWCANFPQVPGNGAIYGHASTVMGDTIYVAGGSSNGTPSATFYKYSIHGNVWTSGNLMPGPKAGGDLVAARGKIYYIGGGSQSMTVASPEGYVYNPTNGMWSSIANIPTPVSGNVAEVYSDSLIYCLLGGWSSFERAVQVYNVTTSSWSQATQIPNGNGRRSFAGGLMGNKIFVCAGFDGSFRSDFWIGTISTSNPLQISWQQRTNLAVQTSRPGGTAINGRFYVVIGELPNGTGSDSMAVWDTTSNTWSYFDGKPTRTNNLYASTSASIVNCSGRQGVKVWVVGGSIQNQTTRPLDVFADTCLTGCQSVISGINNNQVPVSYSLKQNYPNPFNPSTSIGFELPVKTLVNLAITDLTGREVKVLINEIMEPGYHETYFDGSNFASGVYFYKIKTGEYSETKKMVLVK